MVNHPERANEKIAKRQRERGHQDDDEPECTNPGRTVTLSTDDVVEIQQLVARYCHACDSGDADGYASTFIDEGVLVSPPRLEITGREALGKVALQAVAGNRSPRHVVTNLVVDGDGDRATARAYCQFSALKGDPPRLEVLASGVYNDELVRIDGSWKFVRRVFVADR